MAPQAFHIARTVGRRAGALGAPDGFGQAVDDGVLRRHGVAMLLQQPLVTVADARGLVDGQLLAHGKVQAQMEERIGFAVLWAIVPHQKALRLIENGMIFGVG